MLGFAIAHLPAKPCGECSAGRASTARRGGDTIPLPAPTPGR
jgi:hypothetical protein